MYGMDTLKFSARLACQTSRTFVMMNVPRLPCYLSLGHIYIAHDYVGHNVPRLPYYLT